MNTVVPEALTWREGEREREGGREGGREGERERERERGKTCREGPLASAVENLTSMSEYLVQILNLVSDWLLKVIPRCDRERVTSDHDIMMIFIGSLYVGTEARLITWM